MLNQIIFGLLLGWGAAIPIGPINLEIIRRNLIHGTRYGIFFGLGASFADFTYLILLALGTLSIFTNVIFLKLVGVVSALILGWFGYSALKMHSTANKKMQQIPKYLWQSILQGYLLTLINPFTILFWASVSTQIVIYAKNSTNSPLLAGIGVLLGTTSWIIALNTILHTSRHKIPDKAIHYFNIAGGIILLGFAVYGIYHAFKL